jgi:hypothetical protein
MNDSRPYARADYLAIKAATRRACVEAGPLNEIAAQTRVDPAQLSRYGNVEERVFAPVDVAMDLDRLAGGNTILAAWAQVAGFELVPHELHARASRLFDHVAAIARDMSAVIAEIAEPKDDTPARAREVETAAAEAVDALDQLRTDCRRVIAGQAAPPAPGNKQGE